MLTTWDVDVIADVLRFNHWKRTTSHDNFCRLKSFSCGCITQGSYGYICDNKLIIIKRIYQKEIDNLTVFRIPDSILFSLLDQRFFSYAVDISKYIVPLMPKPEPKRTKRPLDLGPKCSNTRG